MRSDPVIIRTRRRTLAIQIDRDGQVTVRAPLRMPQRMIDAFLHEKADWIEQKRQLRLDQLRQAGEPYTPEEVEEMIRQAKLIVPQRAAYFAPIVGVSFGRITVRRQISRWGSCSSQGNLNFNCLLSQLPPELLDYVVVHELCHRLEMNHSDRFHREMERVLPGHRLLEKRLRREGDPLIRRLTMMK